jgi:hypothetical protein
LLGTLALAGCNNGSTSTHAQASPTSAPAASIEAAGVPTEGLVSMKSREIPPDKFQDYVAPKREPREMTLVSVPVAAAPVIDGRADEEIWHAAPAITTLDYSSQRPITLRSVYAKDEIFFLVTFPEETPHETHRTWVWDRTEQVYREGLDYENVFVFKWSMSGNTVDLRVREPMPHRADVWFWKAHRTNPSGYADDKMQGLLTKPTPTARKIQSRHGALYFDRWADAGTPPWEQHKFYEYKGEKVAQFSPREPTGSRGDIRARGAWANAQWTIEFARKLKTGHDDDVAFTPGSVHLFAVACYQMSFDAPQPKWSNPLYRTGDAFDRLLLSLAPRGGR